MLKSLAEYGWEITVICVDPHSITQSQSDPYLESRYVKYYTTIHVPSQEESLLYRVFWQIFPDSRQRPDEKQIWISPATDVVRKVLMQKEFSAVISFAQPWSDHLIGEKIHHMSGLPWIAHFSDPWVDNPYYHLHQKQRDLLTGMERSVIQTADAVIFTTHQTARLVMGKYPDAWRDKTHVIPHGYDSDLIFKIQQCVARQNSTPRLKFLFIGSFYPHIRTPEGLLYGLHLLDETKRNQIEVSLIGPNAETFSPLVHELNLAKTVTLHGPVSYQMSENLSAEADVLLVIDAPDENESVFLPSKLVDYLAFRKPILGLTPLNGASAELLKMLECPVVSPTDSENCAHAILQMIQKWNDGTLQVSQSFEETALKYDVRKTAKIMDTLLLDLVEKRKK